VLDGKIKAKIMLFEKKKSSKIILNMEKSENVKI